MPAANTPSPIQIQVHEKIMELVLNRPAKKNALTGEMYLTLVRGLKQARQDESIHVVLLRGTGDCFCAGNDLKDFLNPTRPDHPSPGRQFLEALCDFTKPIVAAVNGPAVGIGTTMLLHCDLVYAGMRATFMVPFVNLGLCPEGASSLLLPRAIGHPRASEMLLLGEPVSANMAWEYGLINNIYPDDELLEAAFEQARKLARQPAAAVRLTKHLLKASRHKTVHETIDCEIRYFSEMLGSKAFAQACAAFFKK